MRKINLFKTNFRLNFRIKDKNEDTQNKNTQIYRVSFFSVLIFLVLMIPAYIFSWIIFKDVNLNFYFEKWSEISAVIDLPSKANILAPLIVNWIFMLIFLIGLLMLKPFVTGQGLNKHYKTVYLIVLIGSALIAVLASAVSQYMYVKFQDFYLFESAIVADNEKVHLIIKNVSDFFTSHQDEKYVWGSEDVVLWILFIQIIVTFMLSLGIQNAVMSEEQQLDINKYIDYINKKKKNISESKFNYYINKLFSKSDKNISNWTIFSCFCILVPQFIYVILTSFDTTASARLAKLIHTLPEFLKRYEGKIEGDYSSLLAFESKYFIFSSLPVIGMGLTISTVLYFISISLRGENKSQNLFITQYIIIFTNLVIITSINIYSKKQMGDLIGVWNSNISESSTLGQAYLSSVKTLMGDSYEHAAKLYNFDSINGKINFLWSNKTNIVIESIVLFSVILTSFLLIGNNILESTIFKKEVGEKIKFSKILANRKRGQKNA